MSDSDDWEKQLEDEEVLEQNLEKEKAKAKKFKGEDEVDSDEERKKLEIKKKKEEAEEAAKPKKVKAGKKDYDKLFEQRIAGKTVVQNKAEDLSNLSKEARIAKMSMAAEQDITEQLFADLNVNSNALLTEVDYINFGKKVGATLYEGQAPYRLPAFFKELVRDLSKHTDSMKIKEILDSVTAIYNEKVKEEKEKKKTGKGKGKAQLKGGKQLNIQNTLSDILPEDDYGDEEDYGIEGAVSTKKGARVQEEEIDFM